LRATFSPSSEVSYDKTFSEIKSAKLLILEDLRTKDSSSWACEKLLQILDFRYETRLPTVITTSADLNEIDSRIRNRMIDDRVSQVYQIIAPPYQTRTLKRKVSTK
jgi:DNA replication protein DnaC